MEAIIIQHGEAVDSSINPQRPLSQKGREQFLRFADFLHIINWRPDIVLHSGVLRAHESAAILAEKFNCEIAINKSINPNDNPDSIIQYLLQEKRNTIVVTHKPFIDVLVAKILSTSQTGILTITNASPVFVTSDGEMLYCTAYIPEKMIDVIIRSFLSRQV
ncbi:MAG: histidine phosphatase family protein [Spirochaetes bacterium]|nr:histidine phosphatase family protein [Spirochaetota bacterium]